MTTGLNGAALQILASIGTLGGAAGSQAIAADTGLGENYVQRICRNLHESGILEARTTDTGWSGRGRKPRVWVRA